MAVDQLLITIQPLLLPQSLRLVLTQKLLASHQLHPLDALALLSPACTAWLAVAAVLLDLPHLLGDGGAAAGLALAENHGSFLLASVMGFAVNALAILVIKLSSSLMLKVGH